jgi:YHS domain-containing protein
LSQEGERQIRCDNCEAKIEGEPVVREVKGWLLYFCSEKCAESFDPNRISRHKGEDPHGRA